jgi:hypothetical protein
MGAREVSRCPATVSRRVAGLLLAGALSPGMQASAQAVRDSVEATLVGRTETAQVRIRYGSDAPIELESTLPLQLGAAAIPAGRLELRIDTTGAEAVLVVVRATKGQDGNTVSEAVYAKVPMRVTSTGADPRVFVIRVLSQRHAEDTVRIVSQSRAEVNRMIREVVPGTTSTLHIIRGGSTHSVAISAR